jgi:23S rRNA (adenine2503-C2)-methyltransferase
MKAIEILTAEWGFWLGGRRITVSTSGITPKIIEFVERVDGKVRLSVSLHSSKPEVRDELMPINRRYTIENLVETLTQVHKKLKREITFEYTLIEKINDTEEEARGVVKIAVPLNAKVNLIPYNPIREMAAVYKTPSRDRIESFTRILKDAGIHVTLRKTAGREIDAACGQLRLDREQIKS